MAKNKKVIRYKKPLNINVGMIIFAMIFIYLSFSVYTYIRREKVQFYEVVEGSIVNDNNHTGIIFRQEIVREAPQSGYVNYYIREGKRAAAGARVYSLDETGQLGRFLEENQEVATALSSENLSDLKRQLSSFSLSYDDMQFQTVYDANISLQAAVAEYMNFNALGNLDEILREQGISFQQVYSEQAGIVSYALDSEQALTPLDVTAESFDRADYRRTVSKAGDLVEAGSPVYKLITSEDWSIVFPLSEEEQAEYTEMTTLSIRPFNSDLILRGNYSQITGADGNSYGKLDFDRFMVQFVSDRFMDFEIVAEEAQGLKIPVSSITTKEFYTIPRDFLTQGGDAAATEYGLNKQVFSESGEVSVLFTPVNIYNTTDDYYYVDKSDTGPLTNGDYIIKPDSEERFQIGPTATMEGVYNINRGYTVFRSIKELASNGEFYIVERGTRYGISVYDHIVLDADLVTEGQIIYQ